MAVYCVTGKLGSGKTLAAVSRIQDALNKGRKVATNLDLRLEKLINPFAKNTVCYRLPDVPTREDMDAIGLGYNGKYQSEDQNGLLVLDECAKWLNSRDYRDKNRKALIDWMIHARKKRWDVIFIIQDIEAMDKQFRDLFCEFGVYCRRMDRYSIPLLSFVTKIFTGKPAKPPRLHVGLVKYGFGERAPVVDRWWYRGTNLYDAYDTEQGFSEFTSPGLHSMLPPNTLYGRYINKWTVIKNGFLATGKVPFLIGGMLAGSFIVKAIEPDPYAPSSGMFSCNDAYEKLIGCDIKPADLQKIIASHKGAEGAESGGSDTSDTTIEDTAPDSLSQVFISGSVKYDSGQFDYTFIRNGETYEPWANGWRVYDINNCSAMLVNLEDKTLRRKITCVDGDSV